jgi:hypothetical protein
MTERYRALIRTKPEDLLALCEMLDRIAKEDSVCVAAGKELLEACGGEIRDILNV